MPVIQFKGKSAIESYHHTVPHHTLDIDNKLSLAKQPSLEGNLIIEGDNLLALKSLLPTHAGRIKCIYIDPPYNTGNEGWIYNDNLTQPQFKEWIGKTVGKEGEDATRHDKWCCMIFPRVQLLRELLTDDGAIFISIDDNEVHNLRSVMDEVFGYENFVASIVWQKRTSPDARATIGAAHDYIVVYARSIIKFKEQVKTLPLTEVRSSEYKNPDNDTRGSWASVDLTGQTGHATADQFYTIVTPAGKRFRPPKGRCWALAEATYLRLQEEGRIWFGKDGQSRPRLKKFLTDAEGTQAWTWWTNEEVGHNQEATKELAEIFGVGDAFSAPKPVRLIRRILKIATAKDSIVLDSFAGSGTTAHAVLMENHEDHGSRQFILVQMPYETEQQEKDRQNICERITRVRVESAMVGFKVRDAKGKASRISGLGGEFTYVRVGKPIYDEHRDLGKNPPSYEQMARYIWYTETSRPFDAKQLDEKTGLIGKLNGASYYLLYSPGDKDARGLDTTWLKDLKDKNPRKVVYCEKIWIHREDLKQFGDVRPMLVPFNLK